MTDLAAPHALLAVGVGNTSIQAGLFEPSSAKAAPPAIPMPNWHVVRTVASLTEDPFAEVELPRTAPLVVIASVNRRAYASVRKWIDRRLPSCPVQNLVNADFPIALGHDDVDRVGTDRVAAAVATNALRDPYHSAIFVDAGTALTVNAISQEGTFLGGAILPGIAVSLSTLAQFTDQLPKLPVKTLVDAPEHPTIGRNTADAIRSGVFWSAVGAIRQLSDRMGAELGSHPQRFVTGGFGGPLATALGTDTHFVPHLVLAGIALAAAPEWR